MYPCESVEFDERSTGVTKGGVGVKSNDLLSLFSPEEYGSCQYTSCRLSDKFGLSLCSAANTMCSRGNKLNKNESMLF